MTKSCKKCGTYLILGENWSEGASKNYSYICKPCNSVRGKAHYYANPDRSKSLRQIRHAANPEKIAASRKSYYERNKENWKVYQKTHLKKYQTDPVYRARRICSYLRKRSETLGVPFDLTPEWLAPKLQGFCEVTGLPFDFQGDGRQGLAGPWAPSLDRLVASEGYTKNNCRVVVWVFNAARANWGDEVVMVLAKALIKKHEGQT